MTIVTRLTAEHPFLKNFAVMWKGVLLVLITPGAALSLPAAAAHARAPPPRAAAADDGARGGLRLLEWIPSQQLLVGTARFAWTTLWRTMLSELAPQSAGGAYVRPAPHAGGIAATRWPPSLPAVANRYNLYVGNACPWCHRVSATLALRGLGDAIGVTTLADDPDRASRGGWCFDADDPDPLCGASDLREASSYTPPCMAGGHDTRRTVRRHLLNRCTTRARLAAATRGGAPHRCSSTWPPASSPPVEMRAR